MQMYHIQRNTVRERITVKLFILSSRLRASLERFFSNSCYYNFNLKTSDANLNTSFPHVQSLLTLSDLSDVDISSGNFIIQI